MLNIHPLKLIALYKDGCTAREIEALANLKAAVEVGLLDDDVSLIDRETRRRWEFTRWLIQHGRLSEW